MKIPLEILKSLNETIIWCSFNASFSRAEKTTRVIDFSSGFKKMQNYKLNSSERKEYVDQLIETKRKLLLEKGLRAGSDNLGLADGRVMVYEIDNTDSCGLSPDESNGFIDVDDAPGWDTWFHFYNHSERGDCILSWVPPTFIALAHGAMEVNPVDCISFVHIHEELNA